MNIIDHVTLDGVTKYIKDSAGQAMLAPEEASTTAANAYAVGELFRYDGKLYKATSAIAVGDTITPNTNCVETSVGKGFPRDVQINGTSIVSSGVANIPIANAYKFGAVKVSNTYGLDVGTTNQHIGYIRIVPAPTNRIKAGDGFYNPVTTNIQHTSVFYGLAKAAGDTTQSVSTNAVGTYTTEAKTAIQQMLDVPSKADVANLIAVSTTAPSESEAKIWIDTDDSTIVQVPTVSEMNLALAAKVGDVQVNGTSVVSNGVANIPKATDNSSSLGVVGTEASFGIRINSSGKLYTDTPSTAEMKAGTNAYKPIVPTTQHTSVFYGLAKAAGDTTQSISTNAVGTYTDEASAAIRSMLGAVGVEDYASSSNAGVVKVNSTYGLNMLNGYIMISAASAADTKPGANNVKALSPAVAHVATFYGLAKAAGDATQSASSNAVGTYTTEAKAAIQQMLGIDLQSIASQVDIPLVETVSGTTPSITGQPNVRYVCGEVSTITLTPPASGSMDVIFESGSAAAVLTVPNTVKWPAWFDASSLEADTTYEILITDGVYGSVMTWAT